MTRLLTLALIGALFVFITPQLVLADAKEPEKVEVRVHIIHASNEGTKVDASLEDLRRQLDAFSFSSFRLLGMESLTLAFGEQGSISLPGERELTVLPRDRDAKRRLRLRLTIGDIIDTSYTIAEGASLIIGGPRHEGGHLILAVTHIAAP